MKTLLCLTLVSLVIASVFSSTCPISSNSQPKLYSDAVGLSSQSNNNGSTAQNLVYNYQFDSPFSSTPAVAIGLNEIQASSSPVLDIRVSNPRTTTSGIYFQAQSEEKSQWQNFKINFMATTRTDMELGSTSITSPVVNPNDNSFNMIYNIKNDLNATGLKVKSFLQGINVYSPNQTQIGIKQENSYVSNKQIFFSFSSPLKSSIVRSLTISIVVYNIYTPSILYAEGGIDQNYVTSTIDITIPRHGIDELRTYIVGINSFETSASKAISIYSAIDETFSLVIGPIDRNEIDFVSVSYLILSVVDCGSCSGSPLLFDGICQPICPAGYTASKGRCVPIGCQDGQTLNSLGQCVTTCPVNEKYQSGTCICVDNFYRIKNVCSQCPVGTYYDFKELTCKSVCGTNSQYLNGRCYCNNGYYLINNRCQVCSYGTQYNSYTQSCVNICSNSEVYSPSGCICTNGYNRINGTCARCPYQQVYDPDTYSCVCDNGYDLVFGTCVPGCGRNQVRVNGNCLCLSGTYKVNGECTVCGPYSTYSPIVERCLCAQNYREFNGACVANCSYDQYIKDGQCVSYCLQHGEYYSNGYCLCYDDYERINGTCISKCGVFQTRVNGVCQCLPGYYKGYSPICQLVNCPAGTTFDQTRGDCLSICKATQVYINGGCVCKYGYNSLNGYGDCVANCSSTEVNVNGFCECATGYKRISSGACVYDGGNNGNCPSNSIILYGKCNTPVTCGINQYWCGTACICNYGYYMVNGVCVSVTGSYNCPSNSINNGYNCLCNSGYFPVVGGTCGKCGSGQYWNGVQCVNQGNNGGNCEPGCYWDPIRGNCYPNTASCSTNQEWDGATCRCKQGYFLISNTCQQCPAGTVFDGYRCSTGTNYCKDSYSVWNGYGCVCMTGYWALGDGKCVSCPAGTYWDGTCCKESNGKFVPLTTYY